MLRDYYCPNCGHMLFDLNAMLCENCETIFDEERVKQVREYMKSRPECCSKYIHIEADCIDSLSPKALLYANKSLAFAMAAV